MAAERAHLQRLIKHFCLTTRPGTVVGSGTAAAAAAASLLRGLGLQNGLNTRHFSHSAATPAVEFTPGQQAAAAEAAAADSQPTSTSLAAAGVLRQSCRVAGKTWTFETGRLAGLAHGSCLVTVEGTSVLGTAVVDPTPQLEADGVPLQVEYRERMSAAGRLPMRPDRRERVGTEREVLAARLIDRAVRPLLPPGFLYDTQVWVQVLSADGCIDPEVVAINAASAALLLAPSIPFTYPVGAVKVRRVRRYSWKGYKLTINSTVDAVFNRSSAASAANATNSSSAGSSGSSNKRFNMSLVYAGSPYKATAIEATAEQTTEGAFVAAMNLAAVSTRPLITTQQALAAAAAAQQQQQQLQLPLLLPSQQLQQAVEQLAGQPLRQLFTKQQQQQSSSGSSSSDKGSRAAVLSVIQSELLRDLQRMGLLAEAGQSTAAAGQVSREDALRAFDVLQSKVMRDVLLSAEEPVRVDGRGLDDLRPISAEAGPLSRTVHGSGLFTRGETQSLTTATVGHDTEVAPMESLWGHRAGTNLHLHYSFPPFSVGEIGKQGMPNRREIGHGNLARAGVLGLMPSEDEFPFSVRVTADTLSSSGSSSMAAVCAASLALKTAGVPIPTLAAGISVGLVSSAPPQLGSAAADQSAASSSGSSSSSSQQQADGAGAGASMGGIDPGSYSSIVSVGLRQQQETAAEADDSSSSSDSDGEAGSSSSSSSGEEDTAPNNIVDSIINAGSSSSKAGQKVLDSSYGPSVLLTDIQGIEDHLGDMDFKVAGTKHGITAVQLDTKLPGVDLHILQAALQPAAAARRKILAAMETAVKEFETSHASIDLPQYGAVQIMKELVPRLIGPQGTTLTELEEGCGASLIVDDSGTVNIYAPTQMRYQHAVAAVQEVEGRGVVKGEVYRVRVLKVVDFGAYVALPNGLPALLHISELSHDKIREVRDVVSEGQEFDVICKGRDSKGFVQLSLKDLKPRPEGEQPQGSGSEKGQPGDSAMAVASELQAQLAAAAAAAGGRLSSSSSVGRWSQQHHVHHKDRDRHGGSSTGSSSGSRSGRPRAMTWRPPAAEQQQQAAAQQQPQQEQQEQQQQAPPDSKQ